MTQRVFVEIDWNDEVHTVHSTELSHQLKNVLRLVKGDSIIVCDGKGKEAPATLTAITKNAVEFVLTQPPYATPSIQREVTLCVAMLKSDKFDWVVQKATEAGVAHIIPLQTKRTVKQSLRRERIERIMQEAAEQSGRGTMPVLHDIVALEHLGNLINNNLVLFCDVGRGDSLISVAKSEHVAVIVGPEGGWDDQERAYAEQQQWETVSLGNLTLRAETAAVVASFIAVHG